MYEPVLCLNELHSHLLISAKPGGYDKIGISKHVDTRVEGSSIPIYVRTLGPGSGLAVPK